MDETLPPFGVRHLLQGIPYSIVQVNEKQYEDAISKNPDATLSYIDEDDGENVAVGSALELKQRLQDPVPISAPVAPCRNSVQTKREDGIVHLFDIQRTTPSLDVWTRHHRLYQARSRVRQRDLEHNKRGEQHKASSTSAKSINTTEKNDVRHLQDDSNPAGSTSPRTSPVFDLTDAVPDLVENLANILHATSETLRMAARKSRGSKTSPIEEVLSGVGNIVTEIGSFGLSLLDKLDEKDGSNHLGNDVSPQAQSHAFQPCMSQPIAEDKDVGRCSISDASDNISPVSSKVSSLESNGGAHQSEATKSVKCDFCVRCDLCCRKNSDSSCHNCLVFGQKCSLRSDTSEINVPVVVDASSSSVSHGFVPKDESILDQDTDDVDFSRRYPPLVSLRRAHTTAGLHGRYTEPTNHVSQNQDLNRHDTWSRRHPDRPTPQILDAETQRRRHFAQSCFPTQHSHPQSTINESIPRTIRKSTSTVDFVTRTEAWKRNSVPTQHPFVVPAETAPTNNDTEVVSEMGSRTRKTLPGAWPEPHESRTPPNAPSGESSGAFFHRMMRDNPSRKQKHAPDMNERLARHRSFSRQTSNNPFSDLNRSQTVSSATNPASRLNRPFDPLYPIVPQLDTNLAQSKSSSPSPHATVAQCGTSQPLPRLSEHIRFTLRPFSPVWEEHLDDISRRPDNKTNHSNSLDRNGESSSMYSPPPRHMRSVPNFTMSRADATTTKPIAPTSYINKATSATVPSSEKRSDITLSASPLVNATRLSVSPPSLPYQIMRQQVVIQPSDGDSPAPPFPLPISMAPDKTKSQTFIRESALRSASRTKHVSDDATQKCLSALHAMGYGSDDHNLKSRLSMYAEAAGGDVMEAVDMIEEDKKAHFGQIVEGLLKHRA